MRDAEFTIIDNMLRYGGSFAKALAKAATAADDSNYLRLKRAFPEMWQQYGKDWPAGSSVEVLRDPSVRDDDCFRVSFGGELTSPCFNSRGAAEVYAHQLRRGERQPEWYIVSPNNLAEPDTKRKHSGTSGSGEGY